MAAITIEDLPVETKVHILSYLSPKEIQSARRISKDFNAIIDNGQNLTQISSVVHKRNLQKLEAEFNQLFHVDRTNKEEFFEVFSRFDRHFRRIRTGFSAAGTAFMAADHFMREYQTSYPEGVADDLLSGLGLVAIFCYQRRFSDWNDNDSHVVTTTVETDLMLLWTAEELLARHPLMETYLGIGVETIHNWLRKANEPTNECFTKHLSQELPKSAIAEPSALTSLSIGRVLLTQTETQIKVVQPLDDGALCKLFDLPRMARYIRPYIAWCIKDGPAVEYVEKIAKGEINNPLMKAWLLEEMYLY
ncbi:unnamed protein product [Cercospora beticola]|nr:unnamed protein product [Cercospora beticola]